MDLKCIPFSKVSPVRIEVGSYRINDTLIDFMPNLYVPLLGVKSFLSKFILTINYPEKIFSLEKK